MYLSAQLWDLFGLLLDPRPLHTVSHGSLVKSLLTRITEWISCLQLSLQLVPGSDVLVSWLLKQVHSPIRFNSAKSTFTCQILKAHHSLTLTSVFYLKVPAFPSFSCISIPPPIPQINPSFFVFSCLQICVVHEKWRFSKWKYTKYSFPIFSIL